MERDLLYGIGSQLWSMSQDLYVGRQAEDLKSQGFDLSPKGSPSSDTVRKDLLLRGDKPFCFMQASVNWIGFTHVREGNLLSLPIKWKHPE